MELFEGETVAQRIVRCGPFSWIEAQAVARQTAAALRAAHAAGIVHRDIKPENLFLARGDGAQTDSIRVLDFGVATSGEAGTAKLTQANVFIGTPEYCAPEQLCGRPVGPEADVYALGATLFEMLTCRTPFGGDLSEIVQAKVAGPLPAFAADDCVPPVVQATIARALAARASD